MVLSDPHVKLSLRAPAGAPPRSRSPPRARATPGRWSTTSWGLPAR